VGPLRVAQDPAVTRPPGTAGTVPDPAPSPDADRERLRALIVGELAAQRARALAAGATPDQLARAHAGRLRRLRGTDT
jgi:hypothetical protein